MVQVMGIASCSCGSFYSIDTWLFSSLIENQIKEPTSESRESFGIFVPRFLQPRVNDPLCRYYFKTLK